MHMVFHSLTTEPFLELVSIKDIKGAAGNLKGFLELVNQCDFLGFLQWHLGGPFRMDGISGKGFSL